MILKGTFVAKVAISDSDEETNSGIRSGFGGISDRNIRTDEYFYILLFGKCNTFRISLN